MCENLANQICLAVAPSIYLDKTIGFHLCTAMPFNRTWKCHLKCVCDPLHVFREAPNFHVNGKIRRLGM